METEFCIVGAGPAGLAIARELSLAKRGCVVLESGGESDSTEEEAWAVEPASESSFAPFPGATVGRARGIGGTSRLWTGACMVLTASDFETRPWINDSGWPVAFADISRYYVRAAEFLGIDPRYLRKHPWKPHPGHAFPSYEGTLEPTHSILSPRHQIAERLHRELRRDLRISVLMNATVTHLELETRGNSVKSVRFMTKSGARGSVSAENVVLAAGGLENARLLLLSGLDTRGHNAIGSFFIDHLAVTCAKVSCYSPTLRRLFASHYYGLGPTRANPKLQLSPRVREQEGLLSCAGTIVYDEVATSALETFRRIKRSQRTRAAWSELKSLTLLARQVDQIFRHVTERLFGNRLAPLRFSGVRLLAICEQAPHVSSRVALSRKSRDRFGLPSLSIDWRYGEQELETVHAFASYFKRDLERMNWGRVSIADWLVRRDMEEFRRQAHDTFHHMGTTRMSSDVSNGVVSGECRVHGLTNLYVAGSSVFPTGGIANPTLTIVALALRLAQHLLTKSYRSR